MERVLVTGAAGGIGKAVTEILVQRGYEVDLLLNRNRLISHDIDGPGRIGQQFVCDLADRGARADLRAMVANENRPYYGLVHCAGLTHDALVLQTHGDSAHALMEVNYWSMLDLIQMLLPDMMRAKNGRIVAIGSIAAVKIQPGNASYAASKAALCALVRSTAVEVAGRGVTVNEVRPGYVDTAMLAPYDAHKSKIIADIPKKRYGTPLEIASLVAYLFSIDAAYITGASLTCDGGLSL